MMFRGRRGPTRRVIARLVVGVVMGAAAAITLVNWSDAPRAEDAGGRRRVEVVALSFVSAGSVPPMPSWMASAGVEAPPLPAGEAATLGRGSGGAPASDGAGARASAARGAASLPHYERAEPSASAGGASAWVAPPDDGYWGIFCASACMREWCTAANRGALFGHDSECVEAEEIELYISARGKWPQVTEVMPALKCEGARVFGVLDRPRTGLGHFHAIHNYFMHFAVATDFVPFHYQKLLASGQTGAFNADPLLLDAVYAAPSANSRACGKWNIPVVAVVMDRPPALRWAELNDAAARPDSVAAFFARYRVPAPPVPVELMLIQRNALGAVNGNYEVTGPLYRARFRGALQSGLVDSKVLGDVHRFLLGDVALTGEGACDALSLFRIGMHVRRGDIVSNSRYAGRVLNETYFVAVLTRVLLLLPRCLLPQTLVSVFSSGTDKWEMARILDVARKFGVPHMRVRLSTDSPHDTSVASLLALSAQDVMIGSKSGFSHLASVYGPRTVHVGIAFTHPFESVARHVPVVNGSSGAFDAPLFRRLVTARLSERCNRCGEL